MNWKQYFEPHIFWRGVEYYELGYIKELNVIDNQILAVVEGSEEYTVSIELERGKPAYFSCTCPYAEGDNFCKHMAAVSYAWEEELSKKQEKDKQDLLSQEADTLLKQATQEEIRSFLLDILSRNEELLRIFRTRIKAEPKLLSPEQYQAKIDLFLANLGDGNDPEYYDSFYQDEDDYYHYHDDYEYHSLVEDVSPLRDLLQDEIMLMLEKNNLKDALSLTNQIWVGVQERSGEYIDYIEEIVDPVRSIWNHIHDHADEQLRRDMFDWMLSRSRIGIGYETSFLFKQFNEKTFLEEKLNQVKNILEKQNLISGNAGSYLKAYWAIQQADTMKKLDLPAKEIVEFLRQYQQHHDVKIYLVNYCVELGNDDEAEALLHEGIKEEKENRYLVEKYRQRLIDLYLDKGDKVKHRQELFNYVQDCSRTDLDKWKELRGLYSEDEWIEQRKKLLSHWPKTVDRSPIYKEEKMYDELLQSVLSMDMWGFGVYEDILKPLYPKELLYHLKEHAIRASQTAGKRSKYTYIVGILRRMRGYPGGDEVVNKLINTWKLQYKNRPAMMQELQKL